MIGYILRKLIIEGYVDGKIEIGRTEYGNYEGHVHRKLQRFNRAEF